MSSYYSCNKICFSTLFRQIKQETVENKPIDMIRCESKRSSNKSCAYDDADVIIVEDGFLESSKVKKETSVIEKSRMKSSEIVNDWLNDNYKSMVADQRAAAAAAPSHTMTSDGMTELPKLVNADNSSVLNMNLGKSDLATKYFSNANMKYPSKPVCATETLASLQTPFSHFDDAASHSPNSSVKAKLENVSTSSTAVTKSSISRKLLSGGQALFAPATSEKQESHNNFSNLAGFSSSNIGKLEIVKLALADKLASSTQKRSISSSLQQSRPTVLQHTLHRGPSSPAHKIPPQVFPGQATSISPAHADVMPSFLAGTPLEQPPFQGPSEHHVSGEALPGSHVGTTSCSHEAREVAVVEPRYAVGQLPHQATKTHFPQSGQWLSTDKFKMYVFIAD